MRHKHMLVTRYINHTRPDAIVRMKQLTGWRATCVCAELAAIQRHFVRPYSWWLPFNALKLVTIFSTQFPGKSWTKWSNNWRRNFGRVNINRIEPETTNELSLFICHHLSKWSFESNALDLINQNRTSLSICTFTPCVWLTCGFQLLFNFLMTFTLCDSETLCRRLRKTDAKWRWLCYQTMQRKCAQVEKEQLDWLDKFNVVWTKTGFEQRSHNWLSYHHSYKVIKIWQVIKIKASFGINDP